MPYKVGIWFSCEELDGDGLDLAHKEAYENARILHRDVSVGNILITDEGRGLLIDWDMCKHVRDLPEAARQSERTVSFLVRTILAPVLSSLSTQGNLAVHLCDAVDKQRC